MSRTRKHRRRRRRFVAVGVGVGAALLVAATVAAAWAGVIRDDAAPGDAAPKPSAAPVPAARPSARPADCPPVDPSGTPDGPSAAAVTAQPARDGAPRVDVVRYPRPETPGRPWSQWGQGLALADGRFVSAVGNHLGADGNAFLFSYDPERRTLTRFADVRAAAGGSPDWGYGKVHGQIVAGRCGEAFLATYWGTRTGLEYSDRYRGDVLLRIDPASLAVESLGVPVTERGIPSLAGAPSLGLVYGEAADPNPAEDAGREQGAFFVYDANRDDVVFRSDDPAHAGYRNILVDADGHAYLAGVGGQLLVYEPGATELRRHGERLPGGGVLRASTPATADGTVFGATQRPDRLFALRADGSIDDLGPARGYTASMAVEPDGSRVYYVPDAHGTEAGAPLLAFDPQTKEHTTLVELGDLVEGELDLHAAGSYNVVLDAERGLLYVGLNAGASADDAWGETVLAVVHLPGERVAGPDVPAAAATVACRTPASTPGAAEFQAATDGAPGPLELEDVAGAWGADDVLAGMRGHAVAAADVDGDGWTDLFVGTFADRPEADYRRRGATGPAPDRLLLGGPDGFRLDDTFPGERGRTSGAAFADLDGDGDPDLVIARNVRDTPRGRAPSVVLRNDGGRFTPAATLASPAGARSVGVLDADGDGRLDLFVVEDRFSGGASVLWRNRGDLRFEDATDASGIAADVAGLGVATADLDGDGRPDLFVGGSNRLFLNQGDGRFTESDVSPAPWTSHGDEDDPAGVAVGDLNRDGRPDLVVGQHYNSTLDEGRRVPIRLYLNEPGTGAEPLRLRDVTEEAGLVGLPTKSPHVEVADVDADGWPDIVTTAAGADDRPIVFRHSGRGGTVPTFTPSATPGPEQYWVTGVVLDADHDGRLDVVAVEWEPSLPTRFLRNAGRTGHWLAVVAPVGTTVEVFAPGGLGRADDRIGLITVGAAAGYAAGPAPEAWFGLGAATTVDARVSPPGEDPVELVGVPGDRRLDCRSG